MYKMSKFEENGEVFQTIMKLHPNNPNNQKNFQSFFTFLLMLARTPFNVCLIKIQKFALC